MRKQRVVNVLAEEEVRNRQRDNACERRPPMDQRQEQNPERQGPAHDHVETVKKWRCPLETIGVYSNKSSAGDSQYRSRQRQRRPDPYQQRRFRRHGGCFRIAILNHLETETFSDDHLERRETGHDHYKQQERGIVSCRTRHQSKHRDTDVKNHQHAHPQHEAVADMSRFLQAHDGSWIHLRDTPASGRSSETAGGPSKSGWVLCEPLVREIRSRG